jgi:tetraacyldisaccharide 4'-kinase
VKKLKSILLWPFSLLYSLVIHARHFLYDNKILPTYQSSLPCITIGNLSFGGTGKTPHVEYLANYFATRNKRIAVISRGYGRKTKGLLEVTENSTALEVGDEPLQIKLNMQQEATLNVVCEKRADALRYIEKNSFQPDVVLLDDAMQHRAVQSNLSILLTEYDKPFFLDHLFPAGSLRDIASRAKVAQVIIVTKCPPHVDRDYFTSRLQAYSPEALVLFSSIHYPSNLRSVFGSESMPIHTLKDREVVVFSGIADDTKFLQHIRENAIVKEVFRFSDHHIYHEKELLKIREAAPSALFVTTQKDAIRLQSFAHHPIVSNMPIYFLPIEISFDEKEKLLLSKLLDHYVR